MPLARELLLARVAAFRQQNYGYIFDTYHPEAFFRQQFPERDAYLAFASEQLAGRVQISAFQVLREEVGREQARIIFYQRLELESTHQETVECARLLLEDGVWLYHSSQKLFADEIKGDLREMTFADFDRITDKLVF